MYLELIGLSKTYPGRALGEMIPVLQDLNCRLETGQFHFLCRTQRLREDHPAAHHLRPGAGQQSGRSF